MMAIKCSFCGKAEQQTKKIISGPNVWICDECVDLCIDIIAEGQPHSKDQELQPGRMWNITVRVQTDQPDLRKRILDDITSWGLEAVSIEANEEHPSGVSIRRTDRQSEERGKFK